MSKFLRLSVCFVLAVCLAAPFLSGCGNRVVEIPEDKIPAELREAALSRFGGMEKYKDLRWAGFEERGSYVFAACEYTSILTIMDQTFESRMFTTCIARMNEDRSLRVLHVGSRQVGVDNIWEISRGSGEPLTATGRCADKRVHKVVGTTLRGLVLEATPGQNGWWFLISEEARPDDRFDWIGGVGKDGKVVATFYGQTAPGFRQRP